MNSMRILGVAGFVVSLVSTLAHAQQSTGQAAQPLPEIHQLVHQVMDHQKQLEKVRENYTFTSLQTTQDLDANGQVKKTETEEMENFFVNGHLIGRTVKKNGQPLDSHDDQKETERVTKLVEKAQKTPSDQPLEGQTISVSRLLDIMDVCNPRRENYRGRPAIVFEFIGRKDAKTSGVVEDASKKLQGTIWVDEAGRQVAHLEVSFNDNFRVAGGLFASIQKGSSFRFDQEELNGELWLPTGSEATIQARLLMVKSVRQHITERDYDFKRFRVDTQQPKDAKPVPEKKP